MQNTEILHDLHKAVREYRKIFYSYVVEDPDLPNETGTQTGRILHWLSFGSKTQKEIAEKMDIRPQSLTNILDSLENNGWLKRERSEKDRRVQIVTITEEGKKMEEKIHAIRSKSAEDLFGALSDDEKETLYTLLSKCLPKRNAQ